MDSSIGSDLIVAAIFWAKIKEQFGLVMNLIVLVNCGFCELFIDLKMFNVDSSKNCLEFTHGKILSLPKWKL